VRIKENESKVGESFFFGRKKGGMK
jgi:hypothetical protein